MSQGDLLHVVTADDISDRPEAVRRGRSSGARRSSSLLVAVAQTLQQTGIAEFGFANWRPTLYAYILWAICLCWSQVLIRGEHGKRSLFVLPAALFVVSLTVFPLLFGLCIAFSDWNLASPTGRKFNGLDQCLPDVDDPFYWNALRNMVWYSLAILVEYAIAFGLALLLNAEIRARKFFRVAFLLPLMLSPVAVSWMIGKSMLELRFGPIARLGALARLGQSALLRLAGDRALHHHAARRLDLHPLHDDHDPGRPAGHSQGTHRGGAGRRRQPVAQLLGGHLPADAAGLGHRQC